MDGRACKGKGMVVSDVVGGDDVLGSAEIEMSQCLWGVADVVALGSEEIECSVLVSVCRAGSDDMGRGDTLVEWGETGVLTPGGGDERTSSEHRIGLRRFTISEERSAEMSSTFGVSRM